MFDWLARDDNLRPHMEKVCKNCSFSYSAYDNSVLTHIIYSYIKNINILYMTYLAWNGIIPFQYEICTQALHHRFILQVLFMTSVIPISLTDLFHMAQTQISMGNWAHRLAIAHPLQNTD